MRLFLDSSILCLYTLFRWCYCCLLWVYLLHSWSWCSLILDKICFFSSCTCKDCLNFRFIFFSVSSKLAWAIFKVFCLRFISLSSINLCSSAALSSWMASQSEPYRFAIFERFKTVVKSFMFWGMHPSSAELLSLSIGFLAFGDNEPEPLSIGFNRPFTLSY